MPWDREWTEIHTPGHGRRNRVASYEMSDFNYKRQTAKDDNVGRPTMDVVHVVCQLTTTSQTTDEGCRDNYDVVTLTSITPTMSNNILIVMTTWVS